MADLDRTFLERLGREFAVIAQGLKNQLYDEMPLLRLMVENNKETATGPALIYPVQLFRSVSTGVVQGYGKMVTQDQPLTVNATLAYSAIYYGNVSISATEIAQNSGRLGAEKFYSMIETKTNAARSELKEKLYKDLLSNKTADAKGDPTVVGILAAAGSTSNTYAGINRSTAANAAWKPNVTTTAITDDEFVNPTDLTKYGPAVMQKGYLDASHDSQPNLIVVTKNQYNLLSHIVHRQNFQLGGNIAQFGFGDAAMRSKATDRRAVEAKIFYDTYQTARHCFMLTTDDWKAWVFDGFNFDPVKPLGGPDWQQGANQLAWMKTIGWMGQILCLVPRQQTTFTQLASS